jgi:hypothetical protein
MAMPIHLQVFMRVLCHMPHPNQTPPTDVLQALELGTRWFNTGRYWEAHEAWERAWKLLARPEHKQFLQGLIKIAGACHHVLSGKHSPALRLMNSGYQMLRTHSQGYSLPWMPKVDLIELNLLRSNLKNKPFPLDVHSIHVYFCAPKKSE